MSEYIPDMTQRFPDAGEPAEEKNYVVNAWIPCQVQVEAYGTNEADAIKEAQWKLRQGAVRDKIVDWDISEFDFPEVEEM